MILIFSETNLGLIFHKKNYDMKLGRTALHYRRNKKSRDAKKKYDTIYHSTPARKKYRAYLNRERKKRGLKGSSKDLSHTSSNKLVLEDRSKNRARQGSGGGSTKKKD